MRHLQIEKFYGNFKIEKKINQISNKEIKLLILSDLDVQIIKIILKRMKLVLLSLFNYLLSKTINCNVQCKNVKKHFFNQNQKIKMQN